MDNSQRNSDKSLVMKTLLVGCSGGIGIAIARRLKERGHVLIGLDQSEPREANLISSFYNVDLNQTKDVLSVCNRLKTEVSDLWAIIYSAGIYPIVDFEKYTVALWDEVDSVNVRAAFIVCLNLHTLLQDGGRIVTIVGGAAHLGNRDPGYSTSKAALMGLTKSLALNLAHRQIRVNVINPGPIETPMTKRYPPEAARDMINRTLLKRFGRPEEVAVVADFLISPENSNMTGATIDVNGGLYLR
ncbi:SDR family NAD(P)-dependent oxidoreductase [Chloroflexota bacterium]